MHRAMRFVATAATTTIVCAGLAAVPSPAGATSQWPSRPASVHVAATGHNWVTFTAARATNATGYRVFVSPYKADLWGTALPTARASRVVSSSRVPRITVRNLPYKAGAYFYRYQTVHGSNVLTSAILSAYLSPTAASSVTMHSGTHGLYLTWAGGAGTSTVIVQSTDGAMIANRRGYRVRGLTNQLTPDGMTRGVRYYFSVKAYNGGAAAAFSSPVSGVFQTTAQPVRVMSYNILTMSSVGQTPPGSETYASWWQRRPPMVGLIKVADPDIIAVQEGSSPTNGWESPRQVDTLVNALGSTYTVARTEALAGEPGYVLAGNYIVYRNTTWSAVGDGGHYDIGAAGSGYRASYQVLRGRSSGAEVMVVSVHMFDGTDAAACAERARQTTKVIQTADDLAARVRPGGVPIIYAGDWDSAPVTWLPDDSPGRLMSSLAHANDAYWAAQRWSNDKFDTNNKYRRNAVLGNILIDRIFGTPGVAMHYWGQAVPKFGKFIGVIPSDHNPVYADLNIQI